MSFSLYEIEKYASRLKPKAESPRVSWRLNGHFPYNTFNKTMKKITASVLSAAIALGGCATASKDVPTTYSSPMQFSNYTCDQITAESARLQVRLSQLEGRLDTASANDKALTGVALLLFWPAVFALGGTKEQEAEYGRLKGEHDALRQVWIQKNCTVNAATLLPGAAVQATAISAAASPIQGAPQANESASFSVGDRLTYRLREPVSGADQGESKVAISSISNGQIGFDDDSLIMNAQGTVTKGNVVRPTILGVDVSRLQAGNRFQGKYRIVAARVQDVPVDLTVNGVEVLEFSGRRINAVRIDASGYAGRDLVPGVLPVGMGATFSGTLLVEPSTGIVISMKIKSQNPMYSLDWALVGIASSGIATTATPSASTTTPSQVAPMQLPAVTQTQSKEDKLKELKRLYEAGLINAEVYSAQQKTILGN
jgi:hypothetical protein